MTEHQFQLLLVTITILATCTGTAAIVYVEHRSRTRDELRQRLGDLGGCVQIIVNYLNSGFAGTAFWRNEDQTDQLNRLCRFLRRSYPELVDDALAICELAGPERKAERNARNEAFQAKIGTTLKGI